MKIPAFLSHTELPLLSLRTQKAKQKKKSFFSRSLTFPFSQHTNSALQAKKEIGATRNCVCVVCWSAASKVSLSTSAYKFRIYPVKQTKTNYTSLRCNSVVLILGLLRFTWAHCPVSLFFSIRRKFYSCRLYSNNSNIQRGLMPFLNHAIKTTSSLCLLPAPVSLRSLIPD